jgi:hypothetical protein
VRRVGHGRLDGLGGAVEAEPAGDDPVDVDRARGDERDRRRVGVGVAKAVTRSIS